MAKFAISLEQRLSILIETKVCETAHILFDVFISHIGTHQFDSSFATASILYAVQGNQASYAITQEV